MLSIYIYYLFVIRLQLVVLANMGEKYQISSVLAFKKHTLVCPTKMH